MNRVVMWSESGIEYEADQRHAELITKHCKLQPNSKSVATIGERNGFEDKEQIPALDREQSSLYRHRR